MKKSRVQDKFLKELERIPIVQVACERCGISRQTVYRWKKEDPEFEALVNQALDEGEALVNDMGESQLLASMRDGNMSATRYWLSHRHPKFKKGEQAVRNRHSVLPREKYKHLTDEDLEQEVARLQEMQRELSED